MQTGPAAVVCVLQCPAEILSSASAVAKQHPFFGKDSHKLCNQHTFVFYASQTVHILFIKFIAVFVPHLPIVLCEYSKFRIESNSYFSIRFDSKRAQLFEIFEYLPSPSFLLIYKFSVNRLPAKIPVTGCTFQLPIYRVKHACARAQHAFDLCRRSHQRQTPPSSLPPHTCAVDGGGVGTHIGKANTCSGCGRQRTKSRLNGTDVNYITTALRLPGG